MRSLLVTVLVVVLLAAAAVGAGWGLQASALPQPEPGDIAALGAVALLQRFHLVESGIRIDGQRTLRGRCLQGWFPTRRASARGALLQLSDGVDVLDVGRHGLEIDSPRSRPESGSLAVAQLELAACPQVLGRAVERLIQSGARTRAERMWFGRPARAIRIHERTGAVLTLYLAPKRDVLLGVGIDGLRVSGRSHTHPEPLTPATLRLMEGRP